MNARTARLWCAVWPWPALAVAVLALFALGPPQGMADDATQPGPPPSARPKIGLVLAGGGAKGAAHVGVLKVLEEMHIPIDLVVGTSMGSIVGGLYASGMKPDEIEAAINGIDWADVFVDAPERADRSLRRKADDTLYLFKARPGIGGEGIKMPLAVVQGQKFDLQLNRLTARVATVHDFDQLPIPFRAIAADLETGEEVVLKSGDLARAIRASMAVPGAFAPVEIDGKLLVDGGIANNIPVSVARAMGADVLIVSELGTDMLARDQIKSGLDVGTQMVNFLFVVNSRKALATLEPQDVRVSVKLGDISAGSFDRIREAIPLGEQAAREVTGQLSRLAVSNDDYRQYLAGRSAPHSTERPIDFVRIDNHSRVSDAVIADYLNVKPGQPLDVARLEHDLQQIYGLEIFESVRYERVDEGDRSGIVVHAREKAWGPGYLETGLITSSNFEGDSAFRMGFAYTRTALNALNGEWRTAMQIGDEPAIFTELFQPFDPGARYFGFASASYQSQNFYTFDDHGNKLSQVRARGPGASFGLGEQFGTWGELRLGYLRRTGTLDIGIGENQPNQDFDTGEMFLRLTDDKLDSIYFPTEGHFGRIEWRVSRDAFGADRNFEQANAAFQIAHSWGRDTLIGGVAVNTTFSGTAPVQSLQRLGGFLHLSGFEEGQLNGQQAGLGRLIYMRRINDFQQFKVYTGASLEAGNVWEHTSDIFSHDNTFAGSLFIGADTPVGPLYLAYGRNDSGEGSIYLYLGPLFSF